MFVGVNLTTAGALRSLGQDGMVGASDGAPWRVTIIFPSVTPQNNTQTGMVMVGDGLSPTLPLSVSDEITFDTLDPAGITFQAFTSPIYLVVVLARPYVMTEPRFGGL